MEIEVEDLTFARDGRVVLAIPTLTFRAGRRAAILGHNGSGKTTLLRLIAALERPLTGEIRLAGRPVRPHRSSRQEVAFVFQESAFLSRSVYANLELGLILRRIASHERRHRIMAAAELLGVVPLLDRRADQLSGGEARRVGLARALCLRASVVLLDEPLSGLDPANRARLADELPTVLRAFGATTLLVTHDRDEALRLGEDLVVLVAGRVLASGSKREVVESVRSRAVAEALGYTLLDVNGQLMAVPPGGLSAGSGATLGSAREWRMTVEEVVDLVDRREIVGQLGGRRVRAALDDSGETPQPGQTIPVHAARVAVLSG